MDNNDQKNSDSDYPVGTSCPDCGGVITSHEFDGRTIDDCPDFHINGKPEPKRIPLSEWPKSRVDNLPTSIRKRSRN